MILALSVVIIAKNEQGRKRPCFLLGRGEVWLERGK